MSNLLCVTNRVLCNEPFLNRIEKLAAAHPAGILLREKDLTEEAYRTLAAEVMGICKKHDTPCILHSFPGVVRELSCDALHLPLPVLRKLSATERRAFSTLGASCHSVEEALEAQILGCTYITAGHIFSTNCKKGLPGRGLDFLRVVCEQVSIPVYAIGGITSENICEVRNAGATGACVMSSAMTCNDPHGFVKSFEKGTRLR